MVASNRNWVNVLYVLGMCKLLVGLIEETTPLVEQAICFSPRDPFIANWYMLIGTVHLLKSRTDEAICWLERALGVNPELAFAHGHLAAAYALKGNAERAAEELAEARRLSGDGRFANREALVGNIRWVPPAYGTCNRAHFRKMELIEIGVFPIDPPRIEHFFPHLAPGIAYAINDISIVGGMEIGRPHGSRRWRRPDGKLELIVYPPSPTLAELT